MKNALVVMMLCSFGIIFSACSKSDSGGPPVRTAAQATSEGWTAYGSKNYSVALDRFNEAIQLDGNYADAFNGAGWTKAKLDSMAAAVVQFTAGLTKDPANLQMRAGLALVYGVRKEYALSIQRADEVLSADSSWSFSRDLSMSALDLHLLLAEDYFAEANFAASLLQIQVLNPTFSVNVGTESGRAALSAEIERLRPIV